MKSEEEIRKKIDELRSEFTSSLRCRGDLKHFGKRNHISLSLMRAKVEILLWVLEYKQPFLSLTELKGDELK